MNTDCSHIEELLSLGGNQETPEPWSHLQHCESCLSLARAVAAVDDAFRVEEAAVGRWVVDSVMATVKRLSAEEKKRRTTVRKFQLALLLSAMLVIPAFFWFSSYSHDIMIALGFLASILHGLVFTKMTTCFLVVFLALFWFRSIIRGWCVPTYANEAYLINACYQHDIRTTPLNVRIGEKNTFKSAQQSPPIEYRQARPTLNREKYGAFGENHPVMTRDAPVSTFSVDVDTKSHLFARLFLQLGVPPPPNGIRIEELLNYFDYSYPVPQDLAPFAAGFEIAPSLDGSGTHLLKIALKAREALRGDIKKPWNLVFLIDVSGSMVESYKLPLVQRALSFLVEKMRRGDKLAIVTYGGNSAVLLPPTSIGEKEEILRRISALVVAGSTHGGAGVFDAYRLASSAFVKGGVNRVVLVTDGHLNVGTKSTHELLRMIGEQKESGITLSTLGFCKGTLDGDMMKLLGEKGTGNYFCIDSLNEARKVFEDDLFGTMEVLAKDVKVQIEFNPEEVVQYRLIGDENRWLPNEDFTDDRMEGGEIGAGHKVTAMYELVLRDSPAAKRLAPGEQSGRSKVGAVAKVQGLHRQLASLRIRYKAPEARDSTELTFPISPDMVKPTFTEASSDFPLATAVAAFAAKLRMSRYAPDVSYAELARVVATAQGRDPRGDRSELLGLIRNAAAIEQNSQRDFAR